MTRIGITLFSGLGASSLTLRRLGLKVIAHDNMAEAVASLQANGFHARNIDVRQIDYSNPVYGDEVEVVAGGPPCQPFSQSGRNAGQDDPRDMIPDFIRAVAETMPKVFLMENVKGLAGPRHRDYLALRTSQLEALGYRVDKRVLDAADYGVAQNRVRLFVAGVRADLDRDVVWPEPKAQQITMAQALAWNASWCRTRNALAPKAAYDPEGALWPLSRPSTTVVGSFRPEIQAAPGYRKAGDGPRQNAPGSVLTTQRDRLILQGLPEDWVVRGAKGKQDLQIGNSCPPPLLRAILEPNLV